MPLDNPYSLKQVVFSSVELHTDVSKIESDGTTNFEVNTSLAFNKDPSASLFLVSMEITFGSKKNSLYMKITAKAIFESSIGIDKKNISDWLVNQGKARVYPHVCAKILEITKDAGLPTVNIPMELE